jgi:hypothetical protein
MPKVHVLDIMYAEPGVRKRRDAFFKAVAKYTTLANFEAVAKGGKPIKVLPESLYKYVEKIRILLVPYKAPRAYEIAVNRIIILVGMNWIKKHVPLEKRTRLVAERMKRMKG